MENIIFGHPTSHNGAKTMTALAQSEEALEAKDEEKNEIVIMFAMPVKKLSFQIEEKGKRAEQLIIANKELAFQSAQRIDAQRNLSS